MRPGKADASLPRLYLGPSQLKLPGWSQQPVLYTIQRLQTLLSSVLLLTTTGGSLHTQVVGLAVAARC